MSSFSIKYPFFIVIGCLVIAIVGSVTLLRMPVDLFPPINIPVVVVATFYSGWRRADRNRHHWTLRTFLHSGQRNRSYRVTFFARVS